MEMRNIHQLKENLSKFHTYSVQFDVGVHLKKKITDAIQSVTPDVLNSVFEELGYRLDMYSEINGDHIDLY